MKRFILLSAAAAGFTAFFMRPKKVVAPVKSDEYMTYPNSNISITPGDLLFSPIGKSESKYVGHVGIVTEKNEVIHSVPSGIIKDCIEKYFQKFRRVSIYSSKDPSHGVKAARYADSYWTKQYKSPYRVFTPLHSLSVEQYCSKLVWQAYFYGAGINLGSLPKISRAIHPQLLKDRKYLVKK
ncbi:YiiX/YebB-like N1pC/P60 family cysteine hydrolase [Halobacillus massiliensis]|uniref:YiiX/YebB-like N1pC/P60 family cysteine hydrolase n=1 Tax=Halobacillus massiliensis TaxID=1926286 RepID=UPI0009E3173A|nr:YiiX/YebB-like N1pC/P60 family cysteine hydrolase [Halobacillus massiliensis]